MASNETTNDSVIEAANAAPAGSPKKEPPPAVEKDKENETVARLVLRFFYSTIVSDSFEEFLL